MLAYSKGTLRMSTKLVLTARGGEKQEALALRRRSWKLIERRFSVAISSASSWPTLTEAGHHNFEGLSSCFFRHTSRDGQDFCTGQSFEGDAKVDNCCRFPLFHKDATPLATVIPQTEDAQVLLISQVGKGRLSNKRCVQHHTRSQGEGRMQSSVIQIYKCGEVSYAN